MRSVGDRIIGVYWERVICDQTSCDSLGGFAVKIEHYIRIDSEIAPEYVDCGTYDNVINGSELDMGLHLGHTIEMK